MQLLQVDVYGLHEVNLNTSCPHIRHAVITTLKISDTQAKVQLSTSPELFPNKYKPGGTITGVSGKLKGRIDKYGSDELGRWSWITLEGGKDKKITIITAYRVCPGNIHSSDGTIWKQEWRGLTTPSQPTPDPRKQILVDLATFNGESLCARDAGDVTSR